LPKAVVSDTFDRADSTTTLGSADTGQAWTANVGTWGIASNLGYVAAGAGQNVASLESSNADCDVTVTESTAASATGLVFRLSNGTNHLLTNSQSNGQHLYKNVNGYTDLATGGTVELANGDTLKAVLSGSSVIIQLNGTQIISVTETTFQTNTKHGLRSNGATAVRFNNFKVEIAGGSLALTGVG